jgi:hypothetical protein
VRNHGVHKRRPFVMLAAAVLVWGLGAPEARATFINLPTTLDVLTTAGNTTSVTNTNEVETFSQFAYSTSPVGSPPTAANITVSAFGPIGNEAGLSFSGAFFAAAGTTVDYKIQYVITAPAGFVINDALSSATWNIIAGSTGVGTIGETLTPVSGGLPIALPSITSPNPGGVVAQFVGANSFLVQKDILLVGGSAGIGVSIINQGFSSVPEPTSTALLGIGLAGLFAMRFRRSSRRASAA